MTGIAITVRYTDLTRNEATAALRGLPVGAESRLVRRLARVGGARYDVDVTGLSPQGARDLAATVLEHMQAVAQGSTDLDTAGLQAEVERLNGLIAMADRMGAAITQERNDLHAEVERLRAPRDSATAIESAATTVKATGGAVEIAGVRIEPCDTYGATDTTRALDAARSRADAAEARLAGVKALDAEASTFGAEEFGEFKRRLRRALVAADEQAAEIDGEVWPFAPGDVVRDSGEGDDAAWLECAPTGTVVRNADGDPWVTNVAGTWFCLDGGTSWIASRDLADLGQLTVVSVPRPGGA